MTSLSDNEIIEAVARALDPRAFKQQAKYDKYNGDNPAVERDAAVWDEAVSDARAHAKDMLAVAEPLITRRTQEAVLRRLIERVESNEHGTNISLEFKPTVKLIVKLFAKSLGITLDGDGNG